MTRYLMTQWAAAQWQGDEAAGYSGDRWQKQPATLPNSLGFSRAIACTLSVSATGR
jgi:hypothetical protein